jgi:hypothetical protein
MNPRLTVLLVVVLLIFGGAFLAVRLTGSGEQAKFTPWLYQIDDGSIVHIEVSYQGQTVIYRKESGTENWYIDKEPAVPVLPEKWQGTPLLLSGPKVSRVLAEKIENPASYGLEPPLTRVRVTDVGGNILEFHLGKATPDTKNQYARLAGHPALFVVPAEWAQVVNRLATEPPYPPEKAKDAPGAG